MFDAVLKKDNDPISDAEIVEFPIPEDRYKKTIRALNKIQIGSVPGAGLAASQTFVRLTALLCAG